MLTAGSRDSVDLLRRHMTSCDSMVSVCSSGGSQQSTVSDAAIAVSDRKKKPKVWVFDRAFVWQFVLVSNCTGSICCGFVLQFFVQQIYNKSTAD